MTRPGFQHSILLDTTSCGSTCYILRFIVTCPSPIHQFPDSMQIKLVCLSLARGRGAEMKRLVSLDVGCWRVYYRAVIGSSRDFSQSKGTNQAFKLGHLSAKILTIASFGLSSQLNACLCNP